MKFFDKFIPPLPKDLNKKQLISTYIERRQLPELEMSLKEEGVFAVVKFNFLRIEKIVDVKNKGSKIIHKYHERIISGPSEEVYKVSTKQSARIGLNLERQFNSLWNKTLMQLLNAPSKNKSILNLGIYKQDGYGIYDISEPAQLLSQKLMSSGMKQKDLATLAGVDETTLYRHLKGTIEISRDIAIKYAKVLGCDPAEILFNNLEIPVWGSTDTQEMSMLDEFSVYDSEITPDQSTTQYTVAQCPREIYRPDVKAIRIDSPNSIYDNHVAYYYNSNHPVVFEDQMVIVGTKLKNFSDSNIRERFFIGIYKKNKNGKSVDLHSIDPGSVNVEGVTPDEDLNTFEDVIGMVEQQKIVIEDIKPDFVAPVVALIHDDKIYDPIKKDILKAYDTIYTKSRKEEFEQVEYFKKLKRQAALLGKASDHINQHYDNSEILDVMERNKVKLFMQGDKRFQTILKEHAYGPVKTNSENSSSKKISLNDKVKKLNIELSEKEDEIVRAALDKIYDDGDEPNITPEEAGQK